MTSTNRLHPKFTECKQCKTYHYTTRQHPSYKDCLIIQCPLCNSQWYICIQHNNRFNGKNLSLLRKHFSVYHGYESLINTEDLSSVNPIENNDNGLYSDASSYDDCVIPDSKKPKHNHMFSSEHSDSYQHINSNDTLQQIIGTAFSNNELITSNITSDEVKFHLNVTDFCCGISEDKQRQLIDILHQLMSTKFESTRPPTSPHDLQRFYLSGKHSIYKNIPCPRVNELDNHAYVSIKDALQYSLSTLPNISLVQSSDYNKEYFDNSTLFKSYKAKHILHSIYQRYIKSQMNPYILFVTFWSDDFEVNHTRRNRSSTWVKTMTINASKDTAISKHYSTVIALGHKGDNHDTINAHINDELIALQEIKLYYVFQKDSTIPVIVHPLAVLADRPERCTLNSTLSYSGKSTRRWLYSSLVPAKKISSCQQCYQNRLHNYFVLEKKKIRKCNRCSDFDYLTESKAAAFCAPKNYPTVKHPKSPSLPLGRDIVKNPNTDSLFPIKLSYNVLTCGVKAACFNLNSKQWKVSETRTYLKTLGVSSSLTDDVVKHALTSSPESSDPYVNMKLLSLPSIWTNGLFQMEQYLETPMHHLFEGIIKSLVDITMDFLKFHKQWSKFCEIVNPLLIDIESLKLDYCRSEIFWGTTTDYKPTGWIAENYLAYARINLVLLGYIDDIKISLPKALIEFKQMIHSSFVLVANLMSRFDKVDYEEISDLIKIFLSTCNHFDHEFGYSEPNEPFWYRKSNFISLLNLPDQMREYGSLYSCWEGTKERYIQYIKPLLNNKRKTGSFLRKKLQTLLQQNSLDIMRFRFRQTITKHYKRYHDVFIYASKTMVNDKIQNGESLSIIIKNKHVPSFFLVYKENDTYELSRIIFNDEIGIHKNNLWFAPLSLCKTTSKSYKSLDEILEGKYLPALLLCNIYTENINEEIQRYSLMAANWCIRKQNGEIELPELSKNLFQ